jgi:hypothetical protein
LALDPLLMAGALSKARGGHLQPITLLRVSAPSAEAAAPSTEETVHLVE